MVVCAAACGKPLASTGVAKCSCGQSYHKACVGMGITARVAPTWLCPTCKATTARRDNSDNTPVKSNVVDDDDTPTDPQADVAEQLRLLRADFGAVRDDIAGLRQEVAKLHSLFGGLSSRLDVLEDKVRCLEERPVGSADRDPEGQTSAVPVVELQQTVARLQLELNDRDQDALLSDLDIGHIPEAKGENVVHTVTVLAAKLGMTLDQRDVVFAERVGAVDRRGEGVDDDAVGRPRRVVVRLSRRQLRDELLQAARVRRNISFTDGNPSAPPCRVFVNERLTRTNRLLFHKVRELCRQQQWRFSWTRRGRIYARQGEGKPAIQIRSQEDVDRVFRTSSV
ncbi:uncharacterized protein LOC125233510 [Leguminivora glycinivorella]|uniref:uncharacterized protein LOC125233510 n=1 Tax=Leguminivora glycinivorella TaxID=1035111 RepID=UPI0020109742|nr:uncharacterized protein LOC125233510 [Leguminivora glycinivorella]